MTAILTSGSSLSMAIEKFEREREKGISLEEFNQKYPLPPPVVKEDDDDDEGFPPVWKKELEDCPQFVTGLLQPYLKVEDDIKRLDSTVDCTLPPYNSEHNLNIKRFLKLVRETRGFDIDNIPRPFLAHRFPFRVLSLDVLSVDYNRRELEESMNFVVGKINARAKRHGISKRYQLGEFVKVVYALTWRMSLLTFTVKELDDAGRLKVVQAMVFDEFTHLELHGWRFKPEDI